MPKNIKQKFPKCEEYIKKKDMLYLEKEEWEVIELALSQAEQKGKRELVEQFRIAFVNGEMLTRRDTLNWLKSHLEKDVKK